MEVLTYIMAGFAVLGALDYLTGNHLKIGSQFERAFSLAGVTMLAMLGMLVAVPAIEYAISPALNWLAQYIPIDPGTIVGSILPNDGGATQLAESLSLTPVTGRFNGLIVGATMGATISYTLPVVMSIIKKENLSDVLLGLMCGICAIPLGCIVSGFMIGMTFLQIVQNVVPIVLFSGIIAFGLVKFPNASLKIFRWFGLFIKGIIVIGLIIGMLELMLNTDFVPLTAPIEEGVIICFRSICFLSGAFPLVSILPRLLKKPLAFISKKTGLNAHSTFGFVVTLASSVPTFSNMENMDRKGIVLNSAFAVSGAWIVAAHLAWTMSIDPAYCLPVIVAKAVSGVSGVLVAIFILKLNAKKFAEPMPETTETAISAEQSEN